MLTGFLRGIVSYHSISTVQKQTTRYRMKSPGHTLGLPLQLIESPMAVWASPGMSKPLLISQNVPVCAQLGRTCRPRDAFSSCLLAYGEVSASPFSQWYCRGTKITAVQRSMQRNLLTTPYSQLHLNKML